MSLSGRIGGALISAVLMVGACVVVAAVPLTESVAAAPVANGELNVRTRSTRSTANPAGCAYQAVGVAMASWCPTGVPWWPSEQNNAEAIRLSKGTSGAACTTPQLHVGNTPAAAPNVGCDGIPPKSTSSLLDSIFTGRANGHPDVPVAVDSNWVNGTTSSCTVTVPVLTDIGSPTCNALGNVATVSEWSVLEGYLLLPSSPAGVVTVRANNTGSDAFSRAEYVAFMASTDETLEHLEFLGEAATAPGVEANVDFPVAVPKSPTNDCTATVRAFRLLMFDPNAGSAARLSWSLDGGRSFAEIPRSAFTNEVSGTECGSAGKSLTRAPVRTGRDTVSLTYRLVVFNVGLTPLTDVQITDDLVSAPSTWPAGSTVVASTLTPVAGTGCAGATVNPNWDGTTDTAIFDGGTATGITLPRRTLEVATGELTAPAKCQVDVELEIQLPEPRFWRRPRT
ncbi:MAG: hypothetical protein QM733_01550 [Ilumatobacteraceae bacterium]